MTGSPPLKAVVALALAAFVVLVLVTNAPAASMVLNGSFENTGSGWLSPWYLAVKSGGGGTVSQTNATKADGSYAALVNVTKASASAPWLVQLSQNKLAMASGQTYTVSFAAKSGAGRTLDVVLQQTAEPYTVYSESRFGLSTEWQTFGFPYSAPVSDPDVSLHFNVAGATGNVWIDNVAVVTGGSTPGAIPSPSPTITPNATPTSGATPTVTPTVTPTPSPVAGTASLLPVADSTIRADSPLANYGSATTLSSDGSPVMASYLKFDLTSLTGASITKAALRMKVTNGSSSTQELKFATDTSWSEAALTFGSRPPLGVGFKTFGGGPQGSWVAVDVTDGLADKAGRVITLGIDSTGSDGYAFYSRENSTDRVTLVVETQGGGSPTPVSTSTSTPTPTPTPTETSAPTPSASAAPTVRAGALSGKGVALRPFAQYWGGKTAGMNSDYADMNSGDITWARIDLYKTASPDPNFDFAVQAARDHGIKLLVTVRKPAPDKDLGTDADRAAYRLWLGEMVDRYKYHVKHWMIHNEPNLHYEWNINESTGSNQAAYENSVRRYVEHLRDGYETVKAKDPTALVLFAGLSEWTVERYMDSLVKTDAYRYFDIMSFHPYGYNPDRVLSRFNSFKGKISSNANYAAKPIWVTEIGFNTSWSNKAGYVTSEQTKANYLAQTLPRLKAAGAQLPIFWYTLHENENAGGYALTLKNKTTLQTTYLPAFYAYRDLVLPQ